MDAQDSVLFAAYNEEMGWSKVSSPAAKRIGTRMTRMRRISADQTIIKSAKIRRIRVLRVLLDDRLSACQGWGFC
jgi:hypothetical protein